MKTIRMITAFILGIVMAGGAFAQFETRSSASQGVTVKATPKSLAPGAAVWEFAVVLDTHSAELSDDLVKTAALIAPGGTRIAPIAWDGAAAGGHHREGVIDLGTACAIYQNEVLRNLPCKRVQVDEIWSFCYSKQKTTPPNIRGLGRGDVYTWVAIDADTKLVPSWLVGTRDAEYAQAFMADVARRLENRVQLTSDGHKAYLKAVEESFGANVDYAMLVKLYGPAEGNQQERRYSPGHCAGTITGTVTGDPDPAHVSTSYVERQNLTIRMSMKRFARLSNGFSKKIENHEHAIAIHYSTTTLGAFTSRCGLRLRWRRAFRITCGRWKKLPH